VFVNTDWRKYEIDGSTCLAWYEASLTTLRCCRCTISYLWGDFRLADIPGAQKIAWCGRLVLFYPCQSVYFQNSASILAYILGFGCTYKEVDWTLPWNDVESHVYVFNKNIVRNLLLEKRFHSMLVEGKNQIIVMQISEKLAWQVNTSTKKTENTGAEIKKKEALKRTTYWWALDEMSTAMKWISVEVSTAFSAIEVCSRTIILERILSPII